MKVNLKIETPNKRDNAEATKLFRELGYPNLFADEMFVYAASSIANTIRTISFDELRELAREKEYLNDKFELVVTNQPDDGFILVPDGSEYFVKGHGSEALFFYKHDGEYMARKMPQGKNWIPSSHTSPTTAFIILWQRENKVESKGRFLHQEWILRWLNMEDIQYWCESNLKWIDIPLSCEFAFFNISSIKFRLKPQTIQIGSRTINKPISVKPEIGTRIFISSTQKIEKYTEFEWQETEWHNEMLNRNLCHLTAQDAANQTNAFLELMK